MSKSNTHIYNKTILAIAVLSLSACSTAPEREEFQIRHIGQGIITAADATADFSKRAWNRTTYLLGFSDGPTTNANGELLDEVDLALLEEDAAFPDQVSTQAVVVPQATPNRLVIPTVDEEDLLADLVVIDESKVIAQTEVSDDAQIRANGQVLADAELPSTGQILDETQLPSDAQVLDETQLAAAASSGAAAVEDLIHEVQEDQNLWTIAKQTTGDANNWHSIADVNNLAPNASVYPGQQLIIPGDLLETNYDTQVQNTSIAAAGDVTVVEELAAQPAANTDQSAITIVAQEQAEIIVQPESETVGTDQAVLADASANSKGYKLKAGENLWDLAKRVTGDAMNWTLIAAQNNLTEDQAAKVYAGQTI